MKDEMTDKQLWELRQEIVLNSLYYSDYRNSFGFDTHSVCDFFDGYMEYLGELAEEVFGDGYTLDQLFGFDGVYNLSAWYGCFEQSPFIREGE